MFPLTDLDQEGEDPTRWPNFHIVLGKSCPNNILVPISGLASPV